MIGTKQLAGGAPSLQFCMATLPIILHASESRSREPQRNLGARPIRSSCLQSPRHIRLRKCAKRLKLGRLCSERVAFRKHELKSLSYRRICGGILLAICKKQNPPCPSAFELFHSVDSLALAEDLNRIAQEEGMHPHVFLRSMWQARGASSVSNRKPCEHKWNRFSHRRDCRLRD